VTSQSVAPPHASSVAHCFGAHLSIAGGISNAADEAVRLGMRTVQVFVKNQRQWHAPPLKLKDVDRWRTRISETGLGPPVAHATYLINLASSNRSLFIRSRDAFADELRRCQELGIPYLVVHPGAAVGAPESAAIARVARALNRIFDRFPNIGTMPLLELTAGQGTCLGRTFEQIGRIIRLVEQSWRIGVCVDTCHVFAAGYDIRDPEAYEAMLACAEREFGLERVRCWHLNDSRGRLGSRIDRHEHIGRGRIGPSGFRNVLCDPRFRGVPMILETPKGLDARGREWDRVNLLRLEALARAARSNPSRE
jgi:deoxyribonuclease-4